MAALLSRRSCPRPGPRTEGRSRVGVVEGELSTYLRPKHDSPPHGLLELDGDSLLRAAVGNGCNLHLRQRAAGADAEDVDRAREPALDVEEITSVAGVRRARDVRGSERVDEYDG